jgi:hypothetical protein
MMEFPQYEILAKVAEIALTPPIQKQITIPPNLEPIGTICQRRTQLLSNRLNEFFFLHSGVTSLNLGRTEI